MPLRRMMAGQIVLLKFAQYFKQIGHDVTIICASWHHLRNESASKDIWNTCCKYEGVRYFHLPTMSYRGNGLTRVVNMLQFSRGISSLYNKVHDGSLNRPDICIPSCVHPFSFHPSI